MNTQTAVTSLSALAQASRLSVFRLLIQAGAEGLPAGRISEMTGIAPSALSFHLKELNHAGLVSSESAGRFVIYRANTALMNELIGYLTENCCAGVDCGL
ncbi:MAG: ArsR family transcriptional regulator [Burkholderiaceae bacterium]|nr:ArsR family transcriptional regulator [Burkholderiaceae bacterium]